MSSSTLVKGLIQTRKIHIYETNTILDVLPTPKRLVQVILTIIIIISVPTSKQEFTDTIPYTYLWFQS